MSVVEKLVAELRAALRFDDGRYLGHCGSDNILALLDAIEKLEKENEALRAALEPFSCDKLPSSRRIKIAYNRHGLRCAMSDLEIAHDAAARALSTSPPSGGDQ